MNEISDPYSVEGKKAFKKWILRNFGIYFAVLIFIIILNKF